MVSTSVSTLLLFFRYRRFRVNFIAIVKYKVSVHFQQTLLMLNTRHINRLNLMEVVEISEVFYCLLWISTKKAKLLWVI